MRSNSIPLYCRSCIFTYLKKRVCICEKSSSVALPCDDWGMNTYMFFTLYSISLVILQFATECLRYFLCMQVLADSGARA